LSFLTFCERDLCLYFHGVIRNHTILQVEHVIREQNVMAANEIIELFCELIVVRLPIIAKQRFVHFLFLALTKLHGIQCCNIIGLPPFRDCPADLKEGISSLIYAAPRCSEIPELYRISEIFEKKYGKDFVSAARDLRPESGVNRLVRFLLDFQIKRYHFITMSMLN